MGERSNISIAGIELELFERGDGAPVLFLHGAQGVLPAARISRPARKERAR